MSESQQMRETQRFQILELLDADSVNSVKEIVSKMENVSKKLKTIKKDPSPGDLPNPGIEPGSPAYQGDSLPSRPPGKPQKSHN